MPLLTSKNLTCSCSPGSSRRTPAVSAGEPTVCRLASFSVLRSCPAPGWSAAMRVRPGQRLAAGVCSGLTWLPIDSCRRSFYLFSGCPAPCLIEVLPQEQAASLGSLPANGKFFLREPGRPGAPGRTAAAHRAAARCSVQPAQEVPYEAVCFLFLGVIMVMLAAPVFPRPGLIRAERSVWAAQKSRFFPLSETPSRPASCSLPQTPSVRKLPRPTLKG